MNPTRPTRPIDRKLRVLVVDDSLFMRAAIARLLTDDGRFEVIGQAKDGEEAVARAVQLGPDVITMDFNMPRLNGAEAVREIMTRRPTPVIMFSAHTRQGARETFEALSAGAVDFVSKPAGEVSADLRAIADELVAKLMGAAGATPQALAPLRQAKPARPAFLTTWPPAGPRILVVAVSTGGPSALQRLIPALPADTRFSALIVQHMPANFTTTLAERLNALSAVTVREARDGDRPIAGVVYVAPGDRHLEVSDRGFLRLGDGPPVNGCRPSADVTMAGAARAFGSRAIGLVMTGMGRDGTAGLAAIKQAEGITLAQDQASSVIFGMPKAAIDAGVVDEVLPLDRIARRLQDL
ncbi:MAG TPA: chemotaxis response regulator protein-glutamate methylesterase [Kofleriaceae bacterium]|nr:chemotaxis response regulator protein-glutamate methylesterase [Kofleriaceae bacterium]